jgi:excisionase family DNA binding protein
MANDVIVQMRPLALNLQDAGAVLGCRKTKVWELIKKGELEAIRVGADQKVLVSSLEKFVAGQRGK